MPFEPPDFILRRLARPVAILGGGASGQGVRQLVSALGGRSAIYDQKGILFAGAAAASHQLVVFSPGFAPNHPWLREARAAGCACLGELDFASLCWRGAILAVTGTNGKTTLTEFLAHALQLAGRDARPTGNIGRAFSALAAAEQGGAPEIIAVCEVSSFQAETLEHFRAEALLWTNFAEDHLERHGSLEAYFRAKSRLAGVSQTVFAGSSVRAFGEQCGLGVGRVVPNAPGPNIVWVPTDAVPADPRLAGTVFEDYPQRENFLLGAAWWRHAGLKEEALFAAARTFRLGRHRLARAAQIGGVTFWNDSKATNFHAAEAAIARFGAPVVLIAGGKSKGGNVAGFVRRIAPRVRHCCLIGETRHELAASCAANGVPHTVCRTLGEAIDRAFEAAGPGGDVLLSPGFASFDMFRSYEDRGDQFENALKTKTDPNPVLSILQ